VSDIRLLLADPDSGYRDTLAGLLLARGYRVTCASTAAEASACLECSWFHLAILNVHLNDPNDPQDHSGLEILRTAAFQQIPTLLIANHPSVPMAREALRPGRSGLPLAVDFLGKEPDFSPLLAAIEDAVAKHVRRNDALRIRFKDPISLLQLAQQVFPGFSHTRLAERADELEDLVRALFPTARQVTLHRLIFSCPGCTVTELFTHDRAAQAQILVCTSANQGSTLGAELKNTRSLDWLDTLESMHFRADLFCFHYSAPLVSFPALYISSSVDLLLASIDQLLGGVLASQHAKQASFEPPDRFEPLALAQFSIHPDTLPLNIPALCQAARSHGLVQLQFEPHSLDLHLENGPVLSYPNPCAAIGQGRFSLPASIPCGLTFGPVAGAGILVDAASHCWILDQGQAGFSPLVLDYAVLELLVRLECLPGLSLAQRLQMEDLLLADDPPDQVPPQIDKALQSIRRIRQGYRASAQEYQSALFYAALAFIAGFHPEIEYSPEELTIFVHVLLLSAMQLGRPANPAKVPQEKQKSFWIDLDSKEVWVEGKRIELTPQDLDILIYLYRHAGQQRSRQQIIDEAMSSEPASLITADPVAPGDEDIVIEESRLNSAMSRLRKKIEHNPDHPKYLQTIRGYGYRLDVG
jgi:DNA-binding response OmpR family regulator